MAEETSRKFNKTPLDANPRILRRVRKEKANYSFFSPKNIGTIGSLVVLFAILLIPNLLGPISLGGADLISYSVSTSTVTIDGTVNENEYSFKFVDSKLGVEIYSEHDDNVIYFGIICPENGWCAMGFNDPGVTSGMAKADIKFGMMDNGNLTMTDRYASAVGVTPEVDPTSNINTFMGSRVGGKTTFEFSINLNAGTEGGLDQNLVVGNSYTVIYAFHNTDEVKYHGTNRDQISFLISPDKAP